MSDVVYSPSPFQTEFHTCGANEILIGGSAGPGKSLAMLMDPIQTQLVHEHARWQRGEIRRSVGWAIHFRREFKRLEQTIDRSHRIFRIIDPGATFDKERYLWTFSCGYKYQFAHLKDTNDMFNYSSNEYSHIGYDEIPEIERAQYDWVNTRLRSSDPFLRTVLRIVAAANPEPGWVRDYFVDPAPNGRVLLESTVHLQDGTSETRTRIFLPARLKDNPDAEFRRRYEIELAGKPAHIRKALLEGDWYVTAGAFFAEELIPSIHFVEPFKIPSGWMRFRSMDWGYKTNGVVLWWAVDTDGNLVAYRELTFRLRDAAQLADDIREIEIADKQWDERNDCSKLSGPADTQIWEQRGTVGPTVIESMMAKGVYWEKATKDRRSSAQRIISLLNSRGEGGIPGIRFFNTCTGVIKTLPAIGTDSDDPELPRDGGDDHWLDATAYGCMYRAAWPTSNDEPSKDELEEQRRKKKALRQKAGGRYGYGQF